MAVSGIEAGFARADLTIYEPGRPMLGWADPANVTRSVSAPLSARALVLDGEHGLLALVAVELCFVTTLLRETVLARLRARLPALSPHALLIGATHTHSGPAGYSGFTMHDAPSGGFSPQVLDGLARAIVDAVVLAHARRTPAELRLCQLEVPLAEPIAFVRSMTAFLQNPGYAGHEPPASDEVTHRTLTVLRADDRAGRALGLVSWFGVHGTSIQSESTTIHPDNKGVAAGLVEAALDPDGHAVALLLQEAAGDVTPHAFVRGDRRRSRHAGTVRDAEEHGALQARHILLAAERARHTAPLIGRFGARLRRQCLAGLPIPPDLTGGRRNVRTTGATLGLAMTFGTQDGHGPWRGLRPAFAQAMRLARRATGDPKLPLTEVGRGIDGRFLGLMPARRALPWLARSLEPLCFAFAGGAAPALDDRTWVPSVHDFQVIWLGPLTILAVGSEPTTESGRILRRLVPGPVVLTSVANSYSGYVATWHEYQVQEYEGASTQFGPWTLAAHALTLRELLARGPAGADAIVEGPGPELPDLEWLRARTDAGRRAVTQRFGARDP